jgi:hypothetical protein
MEGMSVRLLVRLVKLSTVRPRVIHDLRVPALK